MGTYLSHLRTRVRPRRQAFPDGHAADLQRFRRRSAASDGTLVSTAPAADPTY